VGYDEKTDSMSPSVAGCSLTGGRAVMVHDFDEVEDFTDLHEAIVDLLGATLTEPSDDGRLVRLPPKAHPSFPFWPVSNISSIQGFGEPTFVDPSEELEVPALQSAALYPSYRFTVEFAPRSYPILLDDKIVVVTGNHYFDDDGNPVAYDYVTEWQRYCEVEVTAMDSYIEGRKGQMKFRTDSGATPGGAPGVQFAGAPRMYLPDSLVKVRWYGVPYRYVSSSNSYLKAFKARINQTAIEIQGHTWNPGELLYHGFTFARYTPPIPELDEFVLGLFSTEKLVDIEMTFTETKRTGEDVPSPANPNWIANGHNLLPWLTTRKFYYVTQALKAVDDADNTKWVPTFLSAEFKLLFFDPDV
jgi:hypothetical protein